MWHSQQQHQNGSNLFHNKQEAVLNSPRPSATFHNVSAFCSSRKRPIVSEANEAVDDGDVRDEGERGHHHKVRRGVEVGAAAAAIVARGGVGRWSQLMSRRSPTLPDLELSSMLQSYLDESSVNSVNCQNNQTISGNAYQLRKCQQQPESCQENFSTSLENGKKENNINTNHKCESEREETFSPRRKMNYFNPSHESLNFVGQHQQPTTSFGNFCSVVATPLQDECQRMNGTHHHQHGHQVEPPACLEVPYHQDNRWKCCIHLCFRKYNTLRFEVDCYKTPLVWGNYSLENGWSILCVATSQLKCQNFVLDLFYYFQTSRRSVRWTRVTGAPEVWARFTLHLPNRQCTRAAIWAASPTHHGLHTIRCQSEAARIIRKIIQKVRLFYKWNRVSSLY